MRAQLAVMVGNEFDKLEERSWRKALEIVSMRLGVYGERGTLNIFHFLISGWLWSRELVDRS